MGKMHGRDGSRWQAARAVLPVLVLLLSLTSLPLSAQEDGTPFDLATYLTRLRTYQQQLAANPTVTTLRTVQTELGTIESVVLPSGQLIMLQPLLGTTADETLSVEDAQARLSLLVHQLTASSQDETAARVTVLAEILQRPAFVGQESLWQRFWRWLRQWLPDLGENDAQGETSWLGAWATVLGWIILGVAAVLLVLLLSLWLQHLLASFVQNDADRTANNHADAEPQTAAQARQQAQQLASAGSFREAVRRMYLAALLTLHERNFLHYDRSNTNREVLATVRSQPTLHAQLQPLVETFDDVWYGIQEPDRATFDRYVQAVKVLEEQA